MSIAKEMKNKDVKITALEAESTELSAKVAEMTEIISGHEIANQELRATHDATMATVKDEFASEIAIRDAAIEGFNVSKAESEKILAERDEQIAVLQRALSNPAYADASVRGAALDVIEGGGDGGSEPVAKVSHIERMKAITSPRERSAYFAEHELAIKAEMAESKEG